MPTGQAQVPSTAPTADADEVMANLWVRVGIEVFGSRRPGAGMDHWVTTPGLQWFTKVAGAKAHRSLVTRR